MDYKEMYESVFKRAEKEYNMHKDNHAIGIIDAIERIFPNINKSKEDKIREFLYNLISSLAWRKDWPDNKKDCLAWIEKQAGQKSACSEEDEDRLDIIFERIERGLIVDKDDIDRLKSLKERVQPKQEWSEEDERMLNSALWHVKNSCGNQGKNSGEFEVYNWLKSLRPQNTWKPSDEQIDCLSKHIEYERRWNTSHALNVLSELLEQLKKLKEE